MIVNFNGCFVAPAAAGVPVNDGAVLFGDTLFETLKAHGTTLRFLEHHLQRIERASRLLAMPCDRRRIAEALLETAARLQTPVSRLRLTLSRGTFTSLNFPAGEAGHFIITAVAYNEPTDDERRRGAACVFAPNRRVNPLSHLPQMKRGNYADCLYAAAYARQRGTREALFVSDTGQVLEGATSNLFIVQGGTLMTPAAGGLVLSGILREQVMRAARFLGMTVQEQDLAEEDLWSADEAFLTNALIDVLPIASVENRPLARGPVAQMLLEQINAQVEKNLS